MSILTKIRDAIFAGKPASTPDPQVDPAVRLEGLASAPPTPAPLTGETPAFAPNPQPSSATIAKTPASVDIAVVLDAKAAQSPQKLQWRTSIVDLMKLVGLESSLAERKELATELGYSGSTSDTAAMNTWLHRQVLTKLAENGGQVPPELLT